MKMAGEAKEGIAELRVKLQAEEKAHEIQEKAGGTTEGEHKAA